MLFNGMLYCVVRSFIAAYKMKLKTTLLFLALVPSITLAEERMSQEEFNQLLMNFEIEKSEAKTSVISSLVYGKGLKEAVCELKDTLWTLKIYIDSNPSYAGAHYAYQNNFVDSLLVDELEKKYKIKCE